MPDLSHASPAVLDQLERLQHQSLTEKSHKLIRTSSKAEKQNTYKKALSQLAQSFDEALVEAVALRFDLHAGQRKKLHFKKDRIKILQQHGIDYTAIDGYATAQTLALISQSIAHEDAVVTDELNDVFPFWKTGYPMVQLDNAYAILAEDIQLHYEQLIEALINL